MLQKVLAWIHSSSNVFLMLDCSLTILPSSGQAEVKSLAVDFELNGYFCRLTFWESGAGHVEVLDIDSEKTFIDESIDLESEFCSETPFNLLANKLSARDNR